METRKRSKEEWARRYAAFVVILFVIAFGTSLSIRANLGSSPISAPPYVLSLVPGVGLTMGQLTICMHVFFIAAQVALLRRGFERRQWLQIAVSLLFGFYTDLTMWLTGFLQVPQDLNPAIGLPLRLAELLLGGAVLAFGIAMEVRCDSLMLAGEGFPLAIAKFTGRDFGKVKICTDTLLVCIGAAFMLINFGRWNWSMVGPGTLISMFYVGMMVRVIAPHIAWLDRLLIPKAGHAQAAAPDRWGGHRVVTTLMNQSDMAATLLGQLGIGHADYTFSRDVFSTGYKYPFAFFTFKEGFGFADSTGHTVYDIVGDKISEDSARSSRPDAAATARRLELGKAILQSFYDDLGRR